MKTMSNTKYVQPDGSVIWRMTRYLIFVDRKIEQLGYQIYLSKKDYENREVAAYLIRGARRKFQYYIRQQTR